MASREAIKQRDRLPVRVSAALLLIALTTNLFGWPLAVEAQDQVVPPIRVPHKPPPVSADKKDVTLEDQFPHTDMSYAEITPQTLPVRIQRQAPKLVDQLTQNLFVVLTHTSEDSFAEIYKKNRLDGTLGNFVTVDAVVHPYLAFNNWVMAKSIESYMAHDLLVFLIAVAKSAAQDYADAEDADVRKDIEHNLAFISVAIRLLDPKAEVRTPGQSVALADAEIKAISHGVHATSALMHEELDYGRFLPSGWRNSSEKLRNFYLAYNWISQTSFPIGEGSTESVFRQAALLYSDIERASVAGQPALNLWTKVNNGVRLLGAEAYTGERTLLIPDFDTVFKSRGQKKKLSIAGLADPFYRTKLLLNVRRQKPVEISSRSIFELGDKNAGSQVPVVFRLFPYLEEPEVLWMRTQAPSDEGQQGPIVPIALLALRAHNAAQASNLLAESVWKLDPALTTAVPNLVRMVRQERQSDSVQNWPWSLFAKYLKQSPDSLQLPFKTRNWMIHRLEVTFSAWVDSHMAIFRPSALQEKQLDQRSKEANGGSSSGTAGKPTVQSAPRARVGSPATAAASATGSPAARPATPRANFHYLEPSPDVFHQMRLQSQRLVDEMAKAGYLHPQCRVQAADFTRFLQRLETIALREVSSQPMTASDTSLLANIDGVLEQISAPVTATTWMSAAAKLGEGESASGVAMGLGRPGELLILVRSYRGINLLRGAAYTYYEVPGPPINLTHWSRKLQYGLLSGPYWTNDFDLPSPGLLDAPAQPSKSESK